jgi:AcrR family transcriptional regulator
MRNAILTDWSVRILVSEGNRFLREHCPIRRRRKEARPDEIIEAARAVFVEQGFAAAKVDEIARRAGASKGTVYLYFPTKQALFEAVMRVNVLSVMEQAGEHLRGSPGLSCAEQLRFIIETMYRDLVLSEQRKLLHLIIAEGTHFPELLTFYHREVVSRGMGLLQAVLKRGAETGEFKPEGVERFPMLIAGPILMAAIYCNLFGENAPLDVEDYARVHIAAAMRALGVTGN